MNGQTANRDEYRQRFLGHAHQLLQLGYTSLRPAAFSASEEDDITGELCRHMQALTEDVPTKAWMRLYAVDDQKPVHGVVDPTTGKVKLGKRRPKLDIRFVCKGRMPNPRFCIEAKRLYRSDSVAAYMDDEGLGAFVAGYYAADDDAGGMLGYIQCDTAKRWISELERKVAKEPSVVPPNKTAPWLQHTFKGGPMIGYLSRHNRLVGGPISIYHSLLVFC